MMTVFTNKTKVKIFVYRSIIRFAFSYTLIEWTPVTHKIFPNIKLSHENALETYERSNIAFGTYSLQ